MQRNNAPWITVEGVDGAGKSSHVDDIIAMLSADGFDVVATREPGGTPLGERLRKEILNTPMSVRTEVLLAFASRAEHMDKVIRPAIAQGKAVVCDRFTDSTYAYQGAGEGEPLRNIALLESMVHADEKPDLTLVFDLPVEESFRRLNKTGKDLDKFEQRSREYFQRVRSGYHDIAKKEPHRVILVDSSPSLADVKRDVAGKIRQFLDSWEASARVTPSKRNGFGAKL